MFIRLCLFIVLCCGSMFAATTVVTISSPAQSATVGTPVRYAAAATSDCAGGIAAMRIYSAPSKAVFTANASHFDTTVNLAPGTYNTVVQAWDNCGGVGKSSLTITVVQSRLPVVSVTSPANNSQIGSPAHFVASANSTTCAAGIAAIRIYTAPGVDAYTANASQLSTDLALTPGNYGAVVQAWDKCGGVGKTPVNFTVGGVQGTPARFLYVVEALPSGVFGYVVDPATGVVSPNTQGLVSIGSSPSSVVSDKGGYRLYVGDRGGNVSAYFIDRKTGFLRPVPDSPFAAGDPLSGVVVHPSGKFVFASRVHGGVSVFRVASNGSLELVSGSPFPTIGGTNALTLDQSGRYLFTGEGTVTAANAGQLVPSFIDAYGVDQLTGALTPLANSPYKMSPVSAACSVIPTDLLTVQGRYLYTANSYESAVSGYFIDAASGNLNEMMGSPFNAVCADNNNVTNLNRPSGITVEPTGRFLYAANASANTANIALYGITGSGAVGTLAFLKSTAPGTNCGFKLRADPSGKFVYGFGQTGTAICSGAPIIAGYRIDAATGELTPIFMPNNILGAAFDLAVTP
jgi:6-phosphogluconolactonase (cycloisomerase 2 family)